MHIQTQRKPLDYIDGKHVIQFDTTKYNFRELVRRHLSEIGIQQGSTNLEALESAHKLPGIKKNLEAYRQHCFTFFRTEIFCDMFKSLGAELIDDYFDGDGLIQKTPTVRIQLPSTNSTSYHSDGWYGHGPSVRSFWLPLTKVQEGNTLHMARKIKESERCLDEILQSKADLDKINKISKKCCSPFRGNFGDILTFSSSMIHGAEKNTSDYTRVSFDFRIAPVATDLGSKPRSNFWSRDELENGLVATNSTSNTAEKLCGITYSNLCGGRSAKAQLMLCASFAEANGIDIVGNESEIIALPYMPVLRHYLSQQSAANCVIVFGIDIFDGNSALAAEILTIADENNHPIVFCAEGIIYGVDADRSQILKLVESRTKVLTR